MLNKESKQALEGKEAFSNGVCRFFGCPYDCWTKEANDWSWGYCEAERESKPNKRKAK